MKICTRLAFVALLAAAALTPVAAKDSKAKLQSQWKSRDLRVDGTGDEWTQFAPVSKDSPFMVSVYNNQNFLYLALRTSDQTARLQLLQRGLIVWFDAAGGTKKRFGIQYPIGGPAYGAARGGGRGGGGFPRGGGGRGGRDGSADGGRRAPDADAIWEQAQADGRLDSFDVLGPKKDDRRQLVLGKADGIAAKIWSAEGVVTYELQVPLRVSSELPYGIDSTAPGKVIGLGLARPDVESNGSGFTMGRGGGGMGGGRGGGGGRRGGGGGGRGGGGGFPRGGSGGGGGFQPPKPLKDWTTVMLATEPAAQ